MPDLNLGRDTGYAVFLVVFFCPFRQMAGITPILGGDRFLPKSFTSHPAVNEHSVIYRMLSQCFKVEW
jgi:hypothetical protein